MKQATVIVIVITTVWLIVYDVVAIIEPTGGDSISEILRDWGSYSRAVPYVFGVLMGHWFWNAPKASIRYLWAAVLALVLIGVGDWLGWPRGVPGIVAVIVGIAGGRWCWPLSERRPRAED